MSLKFLNLKGWHPSNKTNQKLIWIAEEKAKKREIDEKDAAKELQTQEELMKYQRIAASRGDKDAQKNISMQAVDFMYAAPPGLKKADAKIHLQEETTIDGEDDAAREFRNRIMDKKGPVEAPSNLERYVGRKGFDNVTIQDQVERFPYLKDAPVEGEYTNTMKVNFKPVGKIVRNIRCFRCKEWGHQSGDRECRLRNENPHDAERMAREDPVSVMKALKQGNLVMKKSALPRQMTSKNAASYDLVSSESSAGEEDAETEYLKTLSTKEKKALLKRLKKSQHPKKRKAKKAHKTMKKARRE